MGLIDCDGEVTNWDYEMGDIDEIEDNDCDDRCIEIDLIE